MRKLLTLFFFLIVFVEAMAQVPQKISYQAVVRNSSNALIVNQTIGLRVSIIQGSILGTAVYVERQSPTTNASGVISIQIGANPLGLSFSSINWINGPFYLKTEIDPTGSNNYTISGISELLSVPYALYAQNAFTVNGLVAVINGGTGAKTPTLARVNLGLGNVDNTRDVDKPISKKVQTALNSKANLEDPVFIGLPEAPTAKIGTNTNQIANTYFVNDAIKRATPDATETVKGLIRLNGDLTGTALLPIIRDKKITTNKLADSAVTTSKIFPNNVTTESLADSSVTTIKLRNLNVTTAKLADNSVTISKILDASITTDKLADSSVTNAKFKDNSINTIKIADSAITTNKIKNLNVTTTKLADSTVTTTKLRNLNVTTEKLADNAVTTAKILDANITTEKLADSSVTNAKFKDNSINTIKIADSAITTNKIRNINVTNAKLADSAVTSNKLRNLNVTTEKIAENAVTTSKILDANITTEKLADSSVTNAKFKDNSINTIKIADSAITTNKIKNLNVTTTKLADSAVTTTKLRNLNVTTEKIANDAVSTIKILDANVTTAKILDANVTTAKIANDAVTTLKIADANVTTAKILDANVTTAKILDANVTTAKILDANVTTAKLADNSVTTAKVLDANVTTDKLIDNAVTTNKITDLNVTTAKLADNSVTTAKMLDANVTTDKLIDNAVTTNKITDLNVTTAKLADNAVTTNKILDENITTSKIADVSVTNPKLSDNAVTTIKIQDLNVTTSKIADNAVTNVKILSVDQSKITGIILGAIGGTGVANTGKTITLGGNLTTSGAFATTLVSTAATNVTLPTTGTLATLAGTETFTNKTISAGTNTISGLTNANLSGNAGISIANGGTGANTVLGAKTNLILDQVDNTRDLNKPISTATQAALDLKAPLASPNLTGIPTAPTAPFATNTTQIATTEFVMANASTLDATTTTKGKLKLAGDLTGTADLPLVAPGAIDNSKISATAAIADTKLATISSLGKVSNSATTATNTNTINTIVLRDGTGNFSANTITASLNGNATNVTGIVLGANGGTGIANTGKTITLGGNLTTSGAFATTLVSTAATNITLPTIGTLATLAGTETFTNKTIAASSNTISGLTNANLSGNAGISIANGGTGANNVIGAKTNFNLNQVDNTTDLNKPISTATQTALDLKAPLLSPNLTGIPSAPTAILGTNTTQIATTEFVMANAFTPDATTTTKGKIQLAGDLSGTADLPSVASGAIDNSKISATAAIADTKLATISSLGKVSNSATTATNTNTINTIVLRDGTGNFSANTITANLTGNATNVTGVVAIANGGTGASNVNLAKTNFNLNLVNNTSDINKPISTATQDALNLKAPLASPNFSGVPLAPTAIFGTNSTQIATTAFVLENAMTPDATTTTKGKIQLAGDLSGTADLPSVASGAIDNSKISATAAIADTKLATISSLGKVSNSATTATNTNTINTIVLRDGTGNFSANTITANLTGNATNVTGVVLGVNGGTGIANTGKTINLGGNLTTTGAYTTNLISTANTIVTLPTLGTLATLAGAETLTGKRIAAGSNTITGLTNTNLSLTAGITGDQLADGAITESKIAIEAVTESKIASDAVTESKIASDAVSQTKIASNAISGDKIQINSITESKIEDDAVTEYKILNGAITSDKIGTNAVTDTKIKSGAVTFSKIQNVNGNKILGRAGSAGIVQELSTSGSGAVILATSPTLFNPNLGTPSAINLSNATFIPLSKNKVNGVLSVSNGGTGADSLSGLLKGDGKNKFYSAEEGSDYSLVREVEDQIVASTTNESSFTLSSTPNPNSIVKMFINGVKVSKTSISVTGTTVTYTKANNRNIEIVSGNIIEFIYYY